MFNIRKIIKKGKYRYALVPEHPKATKNGYVLLHRVLMENKLERLLTEDEVVHHIDKDPLNNDIDNLQLLSKKEHELLHGQEKHSRKKYLTFICPMCGQKFLKAKSLTAKNYKYGPFCSRKCAGIFGRTHYWMRKDQKASVA